jgi:acetoacetate decarboxylase
MPPKMDKYNLRLLIIALVTTIYGFWLSLWWLQFTASDYRFGNYNFIVSIYRKIENSLKEVFLAVPGPLDKFRIRVIFYIK